MSALSEASQSSDAQQPVQPVAKRRPSLLIGSQNSPSLAFLHKPARSSFGNESRENQRLMEENTRKNKMQHSDRKEVVSPSSSTMTDTDDVLLTHSTSNLSLPLVRKKSGEFVRSSLKDHSRSLSFPSTPSDKHVHFGGDSDDEAQAQIKYFDERDTPQAISGENSPTDWERKPRDYFNMGGALDNFYSDESAIEDDYPDSLSDESYHRKAFEGEWKLSLIDFPELSYTEKFHENKEIFLERMFIGDDRENLRGQVAVKNLSFFKKVVVRYSLDQWCTVTEIDCHYVTNATARLRRNNYDRFEFEIPVDTLFHNTEEQTFDTYADTSSKFALCLRYKVQGKEFWDNNDFHNFNVILHKITPIKKNPHKIDTHYPRAARHSSKYLSKKRRESRESEHSGDESQQFVMDGNSLLPRPPFMDYSNHSIYYPGSPDTPSIRNSPYSPIELNPNNKGDFSLSNIDRLDLNIASPKSPLSPISPPLEQEVHRLNNIPTLSSWSADESPTPPKFNATDRPPITSAKYQELLDKYCFSGGESASSVLLQSSGPDYTSKLNSSMDPPLKYPTYQLGNNAGFFDDTNNLISSFDVDNTQSFQKRKAYKFPADPITSSSPPKPKPIENESTSAKPVDQDTSSAESPPEDTKKEEKP